MNIMPGLSWAAFLDGGAWKVWLTKIIMMNCAQSLEQGMALCIIPPITEINATNKTHNSSLLRYIIRHFIIQNYCLLVMSEHGGHLKALDYAFSTIRISGAQIAMHLRAPEVPFRFLIMGCHKAIPFEFLNRSSVIPNKHKNRHAFISLLLE